MKRNRPSPPQAFAAWQELHIWLIEQRRSANQKAKVEPSHLGYRGELVAIRKMIQKVNASKWELRG